MICEQLPESLLHCAVESHKTIGNQANKFLTNKKVHTASQKQTCLTEHRMMYDSIYLWLSPMKSDLTIDSMPVPLRRVCATKPKTIASCKTLQIIRKWTRILVSLGSIISRFFSSRNEDRPQESDRNGPRVSSVWLCVRLSFLFDLSRRISLSLFWWQRGLLLYFRVFTCLFVS